LECSDTRSSLMVIYLKMPSKFFPQYCLPFSPLSIVLSNTVNASCPTLPYASHKSTVVLTMQLVKSMSGHWCRLCVSQGARAPQYFVPAMSPSIICMQNSSFISSEQYMIAYFSHFCVLECVSLYHKKREWGLHSRPHWRACYSPQTPQLSEEGKLPLQTHPLGVCGATIIVPPVVNVD